MSFKKYQSKRLDSWQKAKELNAENYRRLWGAKDEGKLLGFGFCRSYSCLSGSR